MKAYYSIETVPRRLFILFPILALPVTLAAGVDDMWKDVCSQARQASAIKDFAKAESLWSRAMVQAERFGKEDQRVAVTSQGIASLLRQQKKLPEAEEAIRRAVQIFAVTPGEGSIELAQADFDLAVILVDEGKYDLALRSLKRLLPAYDQNFGPGDAHMADALCLQGDSFRMMKLYSSAEGSLKRCADVRSEDGGVGTPEFGEAANSLALVYQKLGKTADADRYFSLAEKIRENVLGITSPEFAETLEAHAALLRQLGRTDEAKKKEKMADIVRRMSHK